MPRLAKIARVKDGKIVSITVCDLDQADEQCRIRGCDSWFEIGTEIGKETETIRTLETGDKLDLKPNPKLTGLALDKTAITKVTKAAQAAELGA